MTIELKNGCSYRGILDESQDNMNCLLKVMIASAAYLLIIQCYRKFKFSQTVSTMQNCTKISPDGEETKIEQAYIRGSQISFVIVPDALSKAPFFNRIKMWRKYKGHAVYGANTAAVEASSGGRGGRGRGGRGGFLDGRGGRGMGPGGGGGRESSGMGRGGAMMMPGAPPPYGGYGLPPYGGAPRGGPGNYGMGPPSRGPPPSSGGYGRTPYGY